MGNCTTQPTEQKQEDLSSPSIKPISLNDETCLAYIINVYDGDTCTANIQSKYGVQQWKIRMSGYDAPELKSHENNEYKVHAKACANILRNLILHRTVIVQCYSYDKWGRVLADVYLSHDPPSTSDFQIRSDKYININRWMMANTPVLPYIGKTKIKFTFNKKFADEYMRELKKIVSEERMKNILIKE